MQPKAATELEQPRFETRDAFWIAGVSGKFSSPQDIPSLWQRLVPHLGKIPGQVGRIAYGVVSSSGPAPGPFEYVAGIEVSDFSNVPPDFARLTIPAHQYAVFAHREHVSQIGALVETIFRNWLPKSGVEHTREPEGTPDFFERYGEGFDPQTGKGNVEVWVPINT